MKGIEWEMKCLTHKRKYQSSWKVDCAQDRVKFRMVEVIRSQIRASSLNLNQKQSFL